MGFSLFISDLHLCESRPEMIEAFVTFLSDTAIEAQNLYILGDLFEYWPGDDIINTGAYAEIIKALNKVGQSDVNSFLIHGNRDFLLDGEFSKATKVTILSDPYLTTLYGKRILMSHGDSICTDDKDYLKFRAEVRNETWANNFLSQPLSSRIAYIESIRKQSEREKSIKSMEIMDVNQAAVESLLEEYDYPRFFIHGHTHRPNRHQYHIKGHQCERVVLGDWYEQGSFLMLDQHGIYERSI